MFPSNAVKLKDTAFLILYMDITPRQLLHIINIGTSMLFHVIYEFLKPSHKLMLTCTKRIRVTLIFIAGVI
jgi:hypothetical protein